MQDGSDPNQPGQIIQPTGSVQPPQPTSQPPQTAPPQVDQTPTQEPTTTAEQTAGWQFAQEEPGPDATPSGFEAEVSWSASEFIAHEKDRAWYIKLFGLTVLGAGVVFLTTQDKISTVMVVVAAAIFGVYAGRQPRTLPYTVNGKGVGIDAKFYGYNVFKSFAVSQDGAFSSIVLMPLKRFMPNISIYYPPEEEQRIVDVLGSYLPQEPHKLDPLDNLMRRVRF